MWENFVFLFVFDTCDVVYNCSLLPPIVLDNLFEIKVLRAPLYIWHCICHLCMEVGLLNEITIALPWMIVPVVVHMIRLRFGQILFAILSNPLVTDYTDWTSEIGRDIFPVSCIHSSTLQYFFPLNILPFSP